MRNYDNNDNDNKKDYQDIDDNYYTNDNSNGTDNKSNDNHNEEK